MPRPEKPRRWESSEIVVVLNYLYDNFDTWYDSPYVACAEAIMATNVKRGGSSVYGKVHNMIRIMDDYLRTGKKNSNTCDILWQNKKVRDLIKEMCYKNTERKRKDETTKNRKKSISKAITTVTTEASTTTSPTSQIDVPQMPFSIETIDEIYNEQIKKVENLVLKSKETIETRNQEIRDLYEQISHRRSELIELIEMANNKLNDLKDFSIV
ncbi:unnamed protein product [Rhizophagus irregularis]|nr:unnamed protein product [Rhizophagus irregularis]